MKELFLNSQEEALTRIVEKVSGIKRETIRGKCREHRIGIPRSILGYMLRYDVGCTSSRTAELVGRHHASVLKYVKDHNDNYKYFPKYREMYKEVQNEFIVGFRGAKIDLIQDEIDKLQKQIDTIKEAREIKININQNQ